MASSKFYRVLPILNAILNSICVVAEFAFAFYNYRNLPLVLDSLCPALTKLGVPSVQKLGIWEAPCSAFCTEGCYKTSCDFMAPK